ncbi:MAG: ABC transporter ATP-binding protein [Solirubrobacterales bacterium]
MSSEPADTSSVPLKGRLRRLLVGPADGGIVPAAPPVTFREIVRHFWPFARPYRRWIALSVVLALLNPLIQGGRLYLVKVTVDEVLVPAEIGALAWIVPTAFGLTLLLGAVSYVDAYLSSWIGERFILSLRTRLFEHLQQLSLSFFEERRLGDLMSRLSGDVSAIGKLVVGGFATSLSSGLTVIIFGVGLFVIEWRLALILVLVGPAFALVTRQLTRLIKRASRERSQRNGAMLARAEESLGNIALVKAYTREDNENAKFYTETSGSMDAGLILARLKALFGPATDTIQSIAALAIVAVGALLMQNGGISLGTLSLFVAYSQQIYRPVRGLSRTYTTFYAAAAGAERVIEMFDTEPEVYERPGAHAPEATRGRLEFDDVTFTYPGTEEPAVQNISFSLEPGETVALVGPSGAGKSTLVRLLLRFNDPDSGSIRLDGTDIRDLELASLRQTCALLLQESLMLDGSIRENIRYGKPDASESEVVDAAQAADADEFIRELSDGYETSVGQRGRRLSGGQRQRVAIARAMIRNAPVLILDEPTTGLDADSARNVLDPLRRLITGRTTVLISHNLLTTSFADLILVLDHGRVTEAGGHDELLARDGEYARLTRMQQMDVETVAASGGAPE